VKQRPRRYITDSEMAVIWDRWEKGDSINAIARDLGRYHSAVQGAMARTGGIRPADRARSLPLGYNGAEFQSRFHWHAESLDIRHVYIRPRSPHLNGKVERSHRIDDQEFYQLIDQNGISDDIHLFNEKVREWEDYYNYHRPHGALQGQTPFERLIEKSRADASQGSLDPTSCFSTFTGATSSLDHATKCDAQKTSYDRQLISEIC